MKISCQKTDFEQALNTVSHAVGTSSNMPTTQHVLIEAMDGTIHLSTNNLETAIHTSCAALIEEEGAVTIPHKTLADVIKSRPDGQRLDMTLEGEENQTVLLITSGRQVTRINGSDPKNFPTMTQPEAGNKIDIDPAELVRGINLVAPSAARDTSRPVLAGIYINLEPDNMTLAAADGFRLSVFRLKSEISVEEKATAIVPTATMRTMSRLARGLKEKVGVSITPDGNHIHFVSEAAHVRSQLIAGSYPDWEKLVPETYDTAARVSGPDFQQVCRTVDIFASNDSNIVRLEFKLADGAEQKVNEMVASASSNEVGDHVEPISAEIEGPENKIAFNNRYLRELSSIMPNSDIRIEMTSHSSPGVFKIADSDDFLQVLMPMYVQW